IDHLDQVLAPHELEELALGLPLDLALLMQRRVRYPERPQFDLTSEEEVRAVCRVLSACVMRGSLVRKLRDEVPVRLSYLAGAACDEEAVERSGEFLRSEMRIKPAMRATKLAMNDDRPTLRVGRVG